MASDERTIGRSIGPFNLKPRSLPRIRDPRQKQATAFDTPSDSSYFDFREGFASIASGFRGLVPAFRHPLAWPCRSATSGDREVLCWAWGATPCAIASVRKIQGIPDRKIKTWAVPSMYSFQAAAHPSVDRSRIRLPPDGRRGPPSSAQSASRTLVDGGPVPSVLRELPAPHASNAAFIEGAAIRGIVEAQRGLVGLQLSGHAFRLHPSSGSEPLHIFGRPAEPGNPTGLNLS